VATHALVSRTAFGWRIRKRIAAAALAAVALLAPAAALACPYCAAGSKQSAGLSYALGAFILLPFVVAVAVYSVLRSEAE
jgi:hypothetical protein